MRESIRNLFILVVPILLMIIVNESINTNTSAKQDMQSCTWHCHDNTAFCKEYHVYFLGNHFTYSDPIYFGIINSLKMTGSYGLANILILAVGFPLLLYYLFIRLLDVNAQIRALKVK